MFSNLRQGNILYILEKGLEKGAEPSLKVGQVTYVGQQMPKYKTSTPAIGMGLNTEMVVDIKVKVGEQDYEFKQLPCLKSVENYGNAIISDSREAMLSEVDSFGQHSQQVLDSVEYHKKVVEATKEMYKTLNPSYAKEQERDEAIKDLYGKFNSFEKKVGTALSNIESLLRTKNQ